jgi:hypothetical protein
MRNAYHPRTTLIVGHSGGSAIAADLLRFVPSSPERRCLSRVPGVGPDSPNRRRRRSDHAPKSSQNLARILQGGLARQQFPFAG